MSVSIRTTILEFPFRNELVELEVDVDAEIIPGEPEERYLPDGSGYPGSDPELDDVRITVVSATIGEVEATAAELIELQPALEAWLDSEGSKTRDRIEEELLDNAANDEPEYN